MCIKIHLLPNMLEICLIITLNQRNISFWYFKNANVCILLHMSTSEYGGQYCHKCPGLINFVVLIYIPWNLDVQKIKA